MKTKATPQKSLITTARETGLTLSELSRLTGMSKSVIFRIEDSTTGNYELKTLLKVAEALEVPPHTLLGGPAANGTGEGQVRHSRADTIRVTPEFNVRTDWGDMETLVAEIVKWGVVLPGHCYPDPDPQRGPNLVNGERRLRGLRTAIERGLLQPDEPKAQFPWLECTADERERTELMLLLNSGKPFTFSELAHAYGRLVTGKKGETMEAVARARNISPSQVKNYVDFLAIVAPDLHAAVDAGECTATLALDLARAMPDKAQQWAIYRDGRAYAGEGEHVTARHLSIPTGKSPGRYGSVAGSGQSAGVPFKDVDTTGGTDHEGRMWTHEKVEVTPPKECGVKASVLVGAVQEAGFRMGYEARWPAVRKGDGRVKELPRVAGKEYATLADAKLAGLLELRGELEAKDFADTKRCAGAERRRLAVEHLDGLIEQAEEKTVRNPVTSDSISADLTMADGSHESHESHESPDTTDDTTDDDETDHETQTPKGGWPGFVLQAVERLHAELGSKLDLDTSPAITLVARAAAGLHADPAGFYIQLRKMLTA